MPGLRAAAGWGFRFGRFFARKSRLEIGVFE